MTPDERRAEQEARERLDRPARVNPDDLPPGPHTDEAAGGEDSSPHEGEASGERGA